MAKSYVKLDIADRLKEPPVGSTDDRVSIWDIPHGWRDRFWIVFSLQALLAVVFESWFELQLGNEPTAWHQTRSIISNTVPYIVMIGPASYLVTEVSVVLSERYLEWRRKKSLEALAGWLTRRQEAWDRGEIFKETIPRAVDIPTIEANLELLLALPEKPNNGSSTDQSNQSALDAREHKVLELEARERRILEKEAWFGRKRLVEEQGGTFDEPYPNGHGASRY